METSDLMGDKAKATEISRKVLSLVESLPPGSRMSIAFALIGEGLGQCGIEKEHILEFLRKKMDEVVTFMMDGLSNKANVKEEH